MSTSTPPPPLFVFDEAGYYFGGQNDRLIDDLRKIDGVPNTKFLVKDGKVFVFAKFVQLIEERRELHPRLPLADLAIGLIAEATVSAKEAVEQWDIVPEPYERVEHSPGCFTIRHGPFNARLPGAFHNKDSVQDAFARLLAGGILSGTGDFAYRGQPMTLCDPLDTANLPPRPAIERAGESENLGYTALGHMAYVSGFDPVSEALFADTKEREIAWASDSTRAARYAQAHAADIWARTAALRLESLDEPTDEVPEYGKDDFAELRPLYPELSMLSDGSLYAWFDQYQSECCYNTGWIANRDDAFVFYLLGKIADRQHEKNTATDVGTWVAYSLLHGDALNTALAFGRQAALYDRAISYLARRIADAVRFVAEDRIASEQRGPTITTMSDVVRAGRKYNVTPVLAEQCVEDFGAERAADPSP